MSGDEIDVRIERLAHAEGLPLPRRASSGSSGLDLHAAVEDKRSLEPLERALVPTGLVVAIPEGCEGQIRPRSGLALHRGVTVLNSPGTIDSDYRGELSVLLINLGEKTFTLARGDRIAQLVIATVTSIRWCETRGLAQQIHEDGSRGGGGFGSSGH